MKQFAVKGNNAILKVVYKEYIMWSKKYYAGDGYVLEETESVPKENTHIFSFTFCRELLFLDRIKLKITYHHHVNYKSEFLNEFLKNVLRGIEINETSDSEKN
jgi:hypothetical protein